MKTNIEIMMLLSFFVYDDCRISDIDTHPAFDHLVNQVYHVILFSLICVLVYSCRICTNENKTKSCVSYRFM